MVKSMTPARNAGKRNALIKKAKMIHHGKSISVIYKQSIEKRTKENR